MQQPPPLPALNPYSAPLAPLQDPVGPDLQLADRGVRLAAVLVDGLIVLGGIAVLAIIAAIVMPAVRRGEYSSVVGVVFGVLVLVVMLAMLIVNCVLLHRYGQTIAKRLFNIKVVRVDGSPCELWRFFLLRWLPVTLLGMIPFLGWLISLADSLMIFRDDYRCMHDIFADTIVVKV